MLAPSLKEHGPLGRKGHSSSRNVRWWLMLQSGTETDECAGVGLSVLSPFYSVWGSSPQDGWLHQNSGSSHLSISRRKWPQRHDQWCLLGDSKSSHVDNQYQPSQGPVQGQEYAGHPYVATVQRVRTSYGDKVCAALNPSMRHFPWVRGVGFLSLSLSSACLTRRQRTHLRLQLQRMQDGSAGKVLAT